MANYWMFSDSTIFDNGIYGANAADITVDSQNNVWSAGLAPSDGGNLNDITTWEVSPTGNLLLRIRLAFSSTSFENGTGIGIGSDDAIYVTGYRGTTPYSLVTAKYNNQGTLIWQRQLTDSNNFFASVVKLDSYDNLCIAAQLRINASLLGTAVCKYNSSGVLQWQRLITPPTTMSTQAVAVDTGDNIYVSSSVANTIAIFKYNSGGTVQWQKSVSGPNASLSSKVNVTDSSDNVYVVGNYTGPSPATNQYGLVLKLDSSGARVWEKGLYGTAAENLYFYSSGIDSSENIFAAGNIGGTAVIAKYDSSGTLLWQRKLVNSYYGVYVNAMTVDSAGDCILCGYTRLSPATNNSMFNVKLKGDGTGTGTYGAWTYSTATYSETSNQTTISTPSYSEAAGASTDAAGSLTSAVTAVFGSI